MNQIPLDRRITEDLSRGCGHAHTFGRCVNHYSEIPIWLDYADMRDLEDSGAMRLDLEDKLGFIRQRLIEVGTRAISKGLEVQCITEHPQFGFYGVPFESYEQVVRPLIEEFESGTRYARPLRMPWGLEVEIIPDDGLRRLEVFTSEMELPVHYGMANLDMLRRAEIILGGVHAKFYSELGAVKTSDDYFEVLSQAIDAMGRLRKGLEAEGHKDKIYVLAHPWYCAGLLKKTEPNARLHFRFSRSQNYHLAELLLENQVVPEFNVQTVRRGYDELSVQQDNYRAETTLIGSYLDLCLALGVDPKISVGSDAHTVDTVGQLDVARLSAARSEAINACTSIFK